MATKRDLEQLDQDLLALLPISTSKQVTVTFIAPDTEQKVQHKLDTLDPVYFVVRKNQPCDVYDIRGAVGALDWTRDYAVLRCNQTATVDILFGVKR